jgi:hypothetical protein
MVVRHQMVESRSLGVDCPLPDRIGIDTTVGLREHGTNSHLLPSSIVEDLSLVTRRVIIRMVIVLIILTSTSG